MLHLQTEKCSELTLPPARHSRLGPIYVLAGKIAWCRCSARPPTLAGGGALGSGRQQSLWLRHELSPGPWICIRLLSLQSADTMSCQAT